MLRFIDVNLSGQDTFGVPDILSERRIPFVFATAAPTAWQIGSEACRR
jgi:hypothetical protein